LPVIVRELSDEDMLKFMGRENGEDYSTEFLVMLNTWEGAVKFAHDHAQKLQPLAIARTLGGCLQILPWAFIQDVFHKNCEWPTLVWSGAAFIFGTRALAFATTA
jgi:hypothetical protein